MDAAQKLASRFGGMLLYIPQQMAVRIRNQEIRQAVWAGEHKQSIGQRFGLVERTIRKIVQGDNFPRYGLTCRHLRTGVQGYLQGGGDDRTTNNPDGKRHGGVGTPGDRTGAYPTQGELFGAFGEPIGGAVYGHEIRTSPKSRKKAK
ncbi:Mor transcription activator family protein, partial [Endozoicomonas sp.]|uniref:Mor transcription activator family protein n=1 Tax=Endozoicomonas sp. TaxID=1892382 RepID=UPI00383B1D56